MTAFTVVYIQLTASQVGAKYLKRGLMIMSETLEELKAIIGNAPVNSTHIEKLESGNIYYLIRCLVDGIYGYRWYCISRQSYVECTLLTGELRSLSDIKRIIELMEWQQNAFDAHPNIDLDIEASKWN